MELPLLEHSCKQEDRTESVVMKRCLYGKVLVARGYRVDLCEDMRAV